MKIIGCIMELNPAHHGHSYFLNQIKKDSDDLLIVIISHIITQRGEFSVINPQIKTQFLLNHGADLVISLPALFANQGGQYFAKYALKYLQLCGITDLYFGSECGNLDYLIKASKAIKNNNKYDFKNGIYHSLLKNLKSNDILGINYLQYSDNINIHLVKRINNNYNDNVANDSLIQSATYIRNHFHDKNIKHYIQPLIYNNFLNYDINTLFPTFLINLHYCLTYQKNIFLSENGQILAKFAKIIKKHNIKDFKTLIMYAKDKNNSCYKLQRIIINIIFLVIDKEVDLTINWIHVLGFTNKGQKYLNNISIKTVTSLKNEDDYVANLEKIVSNVYNILTNQNIKYCFTKPCIKEENE